MNIFNELLLRRSLISLVTLLYRGPLYNFVTTKIVKQQFFFANK